MVGSIADFKSTFINDLSRTSRFDVLIPVPFFAIGQPYVSSKNLTYRCESANLPGRTFEMTEQRTYGPIEKYPTISSYTDMELTFLIDDDMKQKYLFDAWLEYINPNFSNDFKYKEEYATTITINQYDVNNKLSYSVDLIDAYPISMNQMDLNWSDEGIHKLNVTFAYTTWKNNSLFTQT